MNSNEVLVEKKREEVNRGLSDVVMKLDPTIRPGFLTYTAKFNGGDLGNETGVWVCKTSNYFGLKQAGEDDGCDIILLDYEGLLHLQRLVNQAVYILEKE